MSWGRQAKRKKKKNTINNKFIKTLEGINAIEKKKEWDKGIGCAEL